MFAQCMYVSVSLQMNCSAAFLPWWECFAALIIALSIPLHRCCQCLLIQYNFKLISKIESVTNNVFSIGSLKPLYRNKRLVYSLFAGGKVFFSVLGSSLMCCVFQSQAQPANCQFNTTNNQYKLSLNEDTEVELVS